MLAALLLSLATPAVAAPDPARLAGDEALAALAEDRAQAAVREIRARLARAKDTEDQHALRCILGQALRRAGDERGAVAVLAEVPADAPCGPRAAFDRADALQALGRSDEAAAVYAALGEVALGEDRDADLAVHLVALADEALAGPTPEPGTARAVLGLALELEVAPDRRLALAERLAHVLLDEAQAPRVPGWQGESRLVAPVLMERIAAGVSPDEDRRLRLLSARLVDATGAWALLEPLPEDAEVLALRASVALELAPEQGLGLLERAVASTPEDRDLRLALARAQVARQRHRAAAEHLSLLARGDDDLAADALVELARVQALLGDDPQAAADAAVASCARWLDRFPAGARRSEVEDLRRELLLQAARRAAADQAPDALARHDALLAVDPTDAQVAWEAGRAALAAGDAAEARRRWSELLARQPGTPGAGQAVASLARHRLDQGEGPEAVRAWLEGLVEQGSPASWAAQSELQHMDTPALGVEAPDRQPARGAPVVRVHSRNVEQVTVRLHRIDAEAFLRAGGGPQALPALDVAVIAPDREWTAELPGVQPHRDAVTDLPLRTPGPGLYAVTVATDREEARTVVLVSDATLLVRGSGEDLVAAVVQDGRPASGVRVLAAHAGGVAEARTDAGGLARLEVEPGSPVRVLAEGSRGPALAELSWSGSEGLDEVVVGVDLDRPVHRPGDAVGFRALARRDGQPLQGEWTVWLEGSGAAVGEVRLRPDAYGAVHGEVLVPPSPSASGQSWRLVARLPGEEDSRTLASVQVVEEPGDARRLRLQHVEGGAVATVSEADGRPAVGAPVRLQLGGGEPVVMWTDARGQVRVDAPAAGLSFHPQAQLPGWAQWRAADPLQATERPSLGVDLERRRAAAGQPLRARLAGPEGAAVLHVLRVDAPWEPVEAPSTDPWGALVPDRFEGPLQWEGAGIAQAPRRTLAEVQRLAVTLTGEPLELALPALPAGRYALVLEHGDPRHGSEQAEVSVEAEADTRLGELPATAPAGTRLAVPVEGLALVTAEAAGIRAAALVRDGRLSLDLPWAEGDLDVVATGVEGAADHRRLRVDASPEVSVQVAESGARWTVRVQVTDPSGRPARAQVVVRALDARLVADRGRGVASGGWLVPQVEGGGSAGAVAAHLSASAAGVGISQALLAESAREAEAKRAQAAARGEWGGGELAALMEEEAVVGGSTGLGGLGTRGRGSGGGGYGAGAGYGAVGRGMRVGPAPGPAVHDRVLWRVVETDATGLATVELDRPPAGDWLVLASAVTPHSAGAAEARVEAAGPRLLAPTLAAGGPGDRVEVSVQAWNPGEAAELVAEVDGTSVSLAVPAGASAAIPVGPLQPGESRTVRLLSGHTEVDRVTVAFPVRAPTRAQPEGALLRVAAGPGGATPLVGLVQEADGDRVMGRGEAARRGRAALAVLDRAQPSELPALRRQVLAALAVLRTDTGPSSSLDRAEALALLAEVAARLPEAGVTRGQVDEAVAALLGQPETSQERVAQVWALALAGRPVDEPSVGRLLRDAAGLDPETRSWLARALVLLDRRDEALPLVDGEGPHAVLARQALGLAADPSPLRSRVVLPGQAEWAHWVQALALDPGRGRGTAEVWVDGVLAERLDLQAGGELRLVLPEGSRAEVRGAAGALVQRGDLGSGDGWLQAARHPVGLDGLPVAYADVLSCGGDGACRLAVGDRLRLQGRPSAAFQAPGPLVVEGQSLRARAPGRVLLTGWEVQDASGAWVDAGPVAIEIGVEAPAASELTAPAALGLARQAALAETDPSPWLQPWPGFDDLPSTLRPEAMALRFRQELRREASAAEVVAAFEAMRDADPDASLSLSEVAAVARAYAGAGRPDRAIAAWRAGLGAAFLGEAAGVRRLEERVGELTGLRAMRLLLRRYPAVPVVDEAAFHLPERLASLADQGLPRDLVEDGITPTDLRLLSASWDREFLALHAHAPQAPEAGLHLAQGLLRLRAWQQAAEWADRAADRAPESEVLDALRYVEGLARSELGQDAAARSILEALARGEQWPRADGSQGPAGLRPDARYALARLDEARGDLKAAREGYESVADAFGEAGRAAAALSAVSLSPEALVVLEPGDPLLLPLSSTNVDQVQVRAYALDLRTVFLRDGGVEAATDLQVAGVSPAWAGSRPVGSGPFPVERQLALPLTGQGAWLVELDAQGVEARALVVRSSLQVAAEDGAGGRRLQVRRGGRPAAGVEVRALDPYGAVVAERTDLRGVALVPGGSRVLVFDGDQVAFTDPLEVGAVPSYDGYGAEPAALMQNLDRRVEEQRRRNAQGYEQQYKAEAADMLEASTL